MGWERQVFPPGYIKVADDLLGVDLELNMMPHFEGTLPEFGFEVAMLVPPAAIANDAKQVHPSPLLLRVLVV
eukprot:886612-Prorocentrum_minimum.AAC.3